MAYLALFKVRKEDAINAPSEKPGVACLAHAQGELAENLAVADQDVERQRFIIGT